MKVGGIIEAKGECGKQKMMAGGGEDLYGTGRRITKLRNWGLQDIR
jgi:hypothetical protein